MRVLPLFVCRLLGVQMHDIYYRHAGPDACDYASFGSQQKYLDLKSKKDWLKFAYFIISMYFCSRLKERDLAQLVSARVWGA